MKAWTGWTALPAFQSVQDRFQPFRPLDGSTSLWSAGWITGRGASSTQLPQASPSSPKSPLLAVEPRVGGFFGVGYLVLPWVSWWPGSW